MKLFIMCSFVTDSRLHHTTWGGQITSARDHFIAPIDMNLNAKALCSQSNKSILALITLTDLKDQGNRVLYFIYIVNSIRSLNWCKRGVWVSFNLNLSSFLTAILPARYFMVLFLIMYWQDEKDSLKEVSDSHLTHFYVTHYNPVTTTIFPKTLHRTHSDGMRLCRYLSGCGDCVHFQIDTLGPANTLRYTWHATTGTE